MAEDGNEEDWAWEGKGDVVGEGELECVEVLGTKPLLDRMSDLLRS